MADSREFILQYINENGSIEDSKALCDENNFDHEQFINNLKSLYAREMITYKQKSIQVYELTKEAQTYLDAGATPEIQLFNCAPFGETISESDLQEKFNSKKTYKLAFGKCMRNKWFKIDKQTKQITKLVEQANDEAYQALIHSPNFDKNEIKLLKQRKLIKPLKIITIMAGKGGKFALKVPIIVSDLTAEMLNPESDMYWEKIEFNAFNYSESALGNRPLTGRLNSLLRVRQMYREIFFEMGFQEMPTNNFVESSFWNFDSLFQPQQHPAREAHDTFFLESPELCDIDQIPEDYVQRVQSMHENGDNNSIGWRYDWKIEEAQKNILRTHTTAVSSRMLYRLAQEKEFTPKKYFSIDRVFRNETLDSTHLAEFHQVEGLVADYDLNLGNLMGIIAQFFEKLGIKKN
eukprot:TRINITY_DN4491_c0_g1_i1.p1 TRINITY_DN4491_c0_g1~~TRINITY_DN4491_c0_g1_i1.p1  ORF type:complete len:406 (-),score=121.10 TRINITY_DN4491_c0_g1_i1:515-1732(-)